jgi:hypothetical protein
MSQQITARVYENPDALERALVVPRARVIEDDRVALELLRTREFDPAGTVILGDTPLLPTDWDAAEGAAGVHRERAHIVEYTPNRIVTDVAARRPALLFLSEVYAPGWRAFIEGQEIPVYRANVAFRAVPIPSGAHRVWLVYDPPLMRTGRLLSLLAALGAVAAAVVARARVSPALSAGPHTVAGTRD